MSGIPEGQEHHGTELTWGLMHELAQAGNRAAIMLLGIAEAIIALKDALNALENALNASKDQEG